MLKLLDLCDEQPLLVVCTSRALLAELEGLKVRGRFSRVSTTALLLFEPCLNSPAK